jgi:hypothetical protein
MAIIDAAGVSFPVALVFLAGWLAMLAVQNGDDGTAWTAFGFVIFFALVFQSIWLIARYGSR